MKKIFYAFLFCYLGFLMSGCDQDIDFPYEGKDRIQFQHYTVDYNDIRHYSDSINASFGLLPDSIKTDTIKVVMEYLGKGSERERTYHVSVLADSTTAIAGTHYQVFSEEQTFRPNELTDTLRIVVNRENLNSSYISQETVRLYLKLEPTEDFDLGLGGGLTKRILINNSMTEPDWWEKNYLGTLGFFHPEKWKILISFNEEFATYGDCIYTTNNQGRTFTTQLSLYLNNHVVIDELTGMRVTMSGLVEID